MKTLKLLEYNQFLRRNYLEALGKLPWEEVVKDRGASFPSLRDIYLHIVFVLDAYVNYALQGNPNYPSLNYNDYDSIEKMTKYLNDVESKADAYLKGLTADGLAKSIERSSGTAQHSWCPSRISSSTFSRRRPITGEN